MEKPKIVKQLGGARAINVLMVSTGRGEPPDNPQGGVENEAYLLVKNIAKYVNSVHYVENLGKADLPRNVFVHKVTPLLLKGKTFLTEVATCPLLASRVAKLAKRVLSEDAICVVHFHETRGNLPVLFLSSCGKIPKILTIHGPIPWTVRYDSKVESFVRTATYRMFDRHAFDRMDHLIAVCHWLRKNLLRIGLPDHKVSVVYNPIDTSLFSPGRDLQEGSEVLADFGLEHGSYYITVGSLVPRKRHVNLIQAFNLYEGQKKLVIVGDGPEFNNIRRLVSGFGLNKRIRVFRHVKSRSLPYLYSGAQAYVTCSLAEGLPVAVMEAMSSGLGIIAPNASWMSEIVGLHNGILFSPLETKTLSESFDIFDDENLAKQYGLHSRKFAVENFSLKTSALRTLEIYKSVVNQHN